MRRAAWNRVVLLGVLLAASASAGLIPAPPAVVAMWEGQDGASVRAQLWKFASEGEAPGASSAQQLESGEAAWWLGVQDARAGRADSALAQWRRAMRLRGDFDEGFALIDALFRRGRPADVAEAYGYAASLAEQAPLGMPRRAPEAHARLAWARHLRGNSDSALAGIHAWCQGLYTRPQWTRRFAEIERAAGDPVQAWRWLTALSARTRGRDAAIESLTVRMQRQLGYDEERRRLMVETVREPIEQGEIRIAQALGGGFDAASARDGFPLRWLWVPATAQVSRAPLLFMLSALDTLAAADTLVATLVAAGHPVALLAPHPSSETDDFGPRW